jgi:hypothetical protein
MERGQYPIFDKYRGGVLPGQAAAMERELVSLGVSEKVKDRARQTFERSAEQAGFFEQGRNRLVMPGFAAGREGPRDDAGGGQGGGSSGGNPPAPDVDPIIQGLLSRLPKSGEVWPEDERKLWLQLLEGSFKLIYRNNAEVKTIFLNRDE